MPPNLTPLPLRTPSDPQMSTSGDEDRPLLPNPAEHTSISNFAAVQSASKLWASSISKVMLGKDVLRHLGAGDQGRRVQHAASERDKYKPPTKTAESKWLINFGDTVTCLSIDDEADPHKGGIFAACGVNRKLQIFDLHTCRLLRTIHTSDSISSCELVRLPPRKRAVVVGTFNGAVVAYDVDTGRRESEVQFGQGEEVHSVAATRRTPRVGDTFKPNAAILQPSTYTPRASASPQASMPHSPSTFTTAASSRLTSCLTLTFARRRS